MAELNITPIELRSELPPPSPCDRGEASLEELIRIEELPFEIPRD